MPVNHKVESYTKNLAILYAFKRYNTISSLRLVAYGSDRLNVENNVEGKTRVESFSLAYNVNYFRITNIGTNETQKRDCCKKQNLSIHTEHIVEHFEAEKSMTTKG